MSQCTCIINVVGMYQFAQIKKRKNLFLHVRHKAFHKTTLIPEPFDNEV